MTVDELTPLLAAYGLLLESAVVNRNPRLPGDQRKVISKLKRVYAAELANAKEARVEALNLTRYVDRNKVIASLAEEGVNAPALLLTFNDEQLVLLWAWRDAITSA